MLENATRICEAKFGVLLFDAKDGTFRAAALHNVPQPLPNFFEARSAFRPRRTPRSTASARPKQVGPHD